MTAYIAASVVGIITAAAAGYGLGYRDGRRS